MPKKEIPRSVTKNGFSTRREILKLDISKDDLKKENAGFVLPKKLLENDNKIIIASYLELMGQTPSLKTLKRKSLELNLEKSFSGRSF